MREEASPRDDQIRALLVGHDPSDITPITHHLSQHARHIHIEVATSGSDALARVSNGGSGRYDVCLLDHPMPAYPGLELLGQLMQNALPVVLLTKGDDNEVIGSGLRMGAAGHVIKKAGYLEGLPAQLERACGRRNKEEQIAAPAAPKPLSQYQAARENHSAAILRALPDLLLVQTCEGVYLDYHGSDLFLAPGDFLGRNMRNVLPPALADRFLECFHNTAESGEPQVMEYAHSRKGEERFYEARVVSAGKGRMLTIVREITERKRAEDALGEGRERIRELAARLTAAQEQDERVRIANELLDAAANLIVRLA
ncbi:MAG: response regulator [Longimicrobiales bacterium]